MLMHYFDHFDSNSQAMFTVYTAVKCLQIRIFSLQ